MGLDQYLTATAYISRFDFTEMYDGTSERKQNQIFTDLVEQFNVSEHIDNSGFAGISIDFPMGYWRKANQIHNWFVQELAEGDDNCRPMFVNYENLEALRSLCVEVIANKHLASELLPTSAGFFFGSEAYDTYYFADLQNTINIIDRCLASPYDYFQYQASW